MVNDNQIINSFRLVKNDIMKLQEEMLEIGQIQKEILQKLNKLGLEGKDLEHKIEDVSRKKPQTKIITKTVTKTPKKKFIASKEGTKFHDVHCPFAKNIKPKTKIIFKTKETALNKGYKPCACVQ